MEKVIVFTQYSDFANVFFSDSVAELSEHFEINNHSIDLEEGKQPPYGSIHSLVPVELETLKIYLETNLASGIIKPSKLPANPPILFIYKKDGSFWLCVNY